ncbi:mucolipin-3 isoform 3-T3 [Pholidichthys leucotaenia]
MEDSEQLLATRPEERRSNGPWSARTLDSKAVEDFRRRLKYFFMSPCEKYRARGRKPWKLMLQIFKIVIITAQLISFGLSNEMMVTFKDGNLMTFRHIFLKGYKGQWMGSYALYTKTDLYEHIHYIIDTYANLQSVAVANLAYERVDGQYSPLSVCQVFYRNISIDPANDSFNIDPHVHKAGNKDWLLLLFDSVVIFACFISLILCTRSIINGINLQFEFSVFFHTYYNKSVSWSDRMEFVNGWYLLVIVSDTLTMAGSVMKIGIQTKFLTNYDVCSILLGTATMLVWVGVIRYLGFFKKYNILILTLRAALPNVMRFCCCATMIYLGYCFCGWIVLGPYHDKFRTFDKVTECLFSLINGDDMFSTFVIMRDKSYAMWLFSQLYLYSFISLFIYMVLSLFIALITDTYETIKYQQQDKEPVSEVQAFIAECRHQPQSGRYQRDEEPSTCCLSTCACFG